MLNNKYLVAKKVFFLKKNFKETIMNQESNTLMKVSTLLDVEYEEVIKFSELLQDGYDFREAVNGCALTYEECKFALKEIQKRKNLYL